jgi:hypothetical protein
LPKKFRQDLRTVALISTNRIASAPVANNIYRFETEVILDAEITTICQASVSLHPSLAVGEGENTMRSCT